MQAIDYLPQHRKQPLIIPSDPREASSAVLAFIQGNGPSSEKSAAIEAMRCRVTDLLKLDRVAMCEELAAHTSILSALMQRFIAEAITAQTPEVKAKFAKLAIHAQAASLRAMLAIEGIQRSKTEPRVIDAEEA